MVRAANILSPAVEAAYGILQRGSLDAVIHDDAVPVPPVEQVGE